MGVAWSEPQPRPRILPNGKMAPDICPACVMSKEQCKCPSMMAQAIIDGSAMAAATPLPVQVPMASPPALSTSGKPVEAKPVVPKCAQCSNATTACTCRDTMCKLCGEPLLSCVCPERLEKLAETIRVRTKIPDRIAKMLELTSELHGQIGRGDDVKKQFESLEQRGRELLKQHQILAAHMQSGAVKAPVMASHLQQIDEWSAACDAFNVKLCLHGSVVIGTSEQPSPPPAAVAVASSADVRTSE